MDGSLGFLVETTLRSLVVVLTADVVDEDVVAGFAVVVVVVAVASLLLFVDVDAVVSAPVEMAEDSRLLLLSFSSEHVVGATQEEHKLHRIQEGTIVARRSSTRFLGDPNQ